MQTQRLCLVYVIYTLEYLKFRFANLKHSGVILILCLILQKKSLEDGIYLFYQPHIHICWKRNLLFLRNMFEFLGHTQILEVCTASKEIMLFRHDNRKNSQSGNIRFTVGQYWLIIKINGTNSVNFVSWPLICHNVVLRPSEFCKISG